MKTGVFRTIIILVSCADPTSVGRFPEYCRPDQVLFGSEIVQAIHFPFNHFVKQGSGGTKNQGVNPLVGLIKKYPVGIVEVPHKHTLEMGPDVWIR